MKTVFKIVPLMLCFVLIASCGYRNPNVYTGPHKVIYIKEWGNRTSELGLDSELYRSLTKWFQNSSSISTARDKEGADLILAGEIVSIELPSLSYGADNDATEVKVKLRVRYVLKELATNKIWMEVGNETRSEEYLVSDNSTTNEDNEAEAVETIIDELAKKIYQRTVAILPKL